MKKILSLIFVLLIITASLSLGMITASAETDSSWVLGENAEYLTHDGDVYYPVFSTTYFTYCTYFGDSSYDYKDVEFVDASTEEKYYGTGVNYSDSIEDNACVEVYLTINDNWSNTVFYVKEQYMTEYEKLLAGEGTGYYVDAYEGDLFKFSKKEFNSWKSTGAVTIPANSLYMYDAYDISVYSETELLSAYCGYALVDSESNEAYILMFSDYDPNKLYSKDDMITVYKVGDERAADLVAYCTSDIEDELEWLNPGLVNMDVVKVICVVLFCVIPFALLAATAVMFFVGKNKVYRRCYVIVAIGAVLVLISFVLMIILV